MGYTNFLIACTERVDLVKATFEMATEWVIEVARKAVDLGAESASICFARAAFLENLTVYGV